MLHHLTPAVLAVDVMTDVVRPLVSIVVLGSVAIGMLVIALKIVERALPFDVHHELEEDHNVAAAIVMGSVILGVALVIASVVNG